MTRERANEIEWKVFSLNSVRIINALEKCHDAIAIFELGRAYENMKLDFRYELEKEIEVEE